ncbi:hypothetical protein [Nocardia neocaledoniensis]|uniref:hypothetical protein n=1 Tax=Nocardia neocaledoniensis TaxID=236511 RepID=UPI002458BF17|nr:hypothetical protein [Nocardia neocaledoniensis]
MTGGDPRCRHLTAIVDSVMRSGRAEELAATMAMLDIIVTTHPVAETAIEEVVIRAPGSLVPVADGTVVIECLSATYPNQHTAPVEEAVPLFWQAVETMFGIAPRPPIE